MGKLDKALDAAPGNGWVVVDMAKDWKRVFADAPSHGAFVVADGFAGGRAVRGKDHALMHRCAVSVDGDLRNAFGNSGPANRLANHKPPAQQARMLPGGDDVAFDTG